jgi:hypothetical protein
MSKYLLIRRGYNIQDARTKDLSSTQKINVHTRARNPQSMTINEFIRDKHNIIHKTDFRYFLVVYSLSLSSSYVLPDYKDAFYLI